MWRSSRRDASSPSHPLPWQWLGLVLGVLGVAGLAFAWLVLAGPAAPSASARRPARATPRAEAVAAPTRPPARATPDPAASAPGEVARRFLAAWQAGDYAAMYELLDAGSRRRVGRDEFIAPYRALQDEAGVVGLTARLAAGTSPLAPRQPFELTVETARAGRFADANALALTLADGRWGVAWQPAAIVHDLQPGEGLRLLPDTPRRGRILDRHGNVLAHQVEMATIGVVPVELTDPAVVDELAAALGLAPEAIRLAIARSQPDWFVPLARRPWRAPPPALQRLADRPGVEVRVGLARAYPHGALAAHVIGYVAEVDADEAVALRGRGYLAGEWIGRAGIEAAAEAELAGERGGQVVIVAPDGATRRVLAERPARPARDVYLTLDLAWQRQAEVELGQRAGAVIGLEPATGAVRLMVSRPAFDPNVFVQGRASDLAALLADEQGQPLVNRATQRAYPPGSVFKVVTLAAAMEELRLPGEAPMNCPATFRLPGRPEVWRDWQPGGQGMVTLRGALVRSCNTVFYQLASQLDARRPEALPAMARRFGLGQPAGLRELPEAAGVAPGPAWKQAVLGESWWTGDAINLSIGQGDLQATPLQVARAYAAIANGGVLWRPYLIEQIRVPNGDATRAATPAAGGQLALGPETVATLRGALAEVPARLAAGDYTAFRDYHGPVVAGKTGTAETGVAGVTHAWFAAYAPASRPQLALAVLVERGGEGATVAAPVARLIVEGGSAPGGRGAKGEGGRVN